jgi:hypothetical protein
MSPSIPASHIMTNKVAHELVMPKSIEYGMLSPELLLEYCKTKMRGIDDQVQRAFAGQKTRNDLSKALSDLANAFQKKEITADDQTTKNAAYKAFDEAIAAAGPTSQLGIELQALKASFTTDANGGSEHNDARVAEAELKTFLDTVGRIQTDVNREGELEMIQLQSLMSQRQQAIQMCSNMVANLGQTSLAIVQNMK